MAKQIKYGQDARHALESGINQLANTVKTPMIRHVLLKRQQLRQKEKRLISNIPWMKTRLRKKLCMMGFTQYVPIFLMIMLLIF